MLLGYSDSDSACQSGERGIHAYPIVVTVAALGAAFGVTVVATPILVAILRSRGVLAHPNQRSSHDRPTPTGGGMAPALGVAVGLFVLTPTTGLRLPLLGVGAAFGALGFLDDLTGLPAGVRLLFQALFAGIGVALLTAIPAVSSAWLLPVACLALLWITGYVNAFNFMDGINGISCSQTVATALAWGFVGYSQGQTEFGSVSLVMGAAALGFLPYNAPRARVFMGDAGSYFLGSVMALLAVVGLGRGLAPEAVLAPLSLSLVDTTVTLARRFARGDRWYRAHREHTYQQLTDLGWSHTQVSLFVFVVVMICALLGGVSLSPFLAARVMADLGLTLVLGVYLTSPGIVRHWSRPPRSRVA